MVWCILVGSHTHWIFWPFLHINHFDFTHWVIYFYKFQEFWSSIFCIEMFYWLCDFECKENRFWEEHDQRASEKLKRVRAFYLVFPGFGDFIFSSRAKEVLVTLIVRLAVVWISSWLQSFLIEQLLSLWFLNIMVYSLYLN